MENTFTFGIDTTSNAKENVETLLKEAGFFLGELRYMGEITKIFICDRLRNFNPCQSVLIRV